ncbi:MAG: hypothetical protein R3332_00300 [Pseudohongiellaceae bacterium]|nr:hypothetical protein [Pseudohongiellaceae bacterium]
MSKTFENASVYPLQWPHGFPVTERRETSRFNTSLFKALENVKSALTKFGSDSNKKVSDIVISSNYSLSDTRPSEPGVAVYFTWDEERTCIPVDRYTLVEDNLQAIYHCIEADRTKLRHSGVNLVKAAFRGYASLPNPNSINWRDVLDYRGDNLAECKQAYRRAIKNAHPDNGGNTEQAARVNKAWELAQQELRA